MITIDNVYKDNDIFFLITIDNVNIFKLIIMRFSPVYIVERTVT